MIADTHVDAATAFALAAAGECQHGVDNHGTHRSGRGPASPSATVGVDNGHHSPGRPGWGIFPHPVAPTHATSSASLLSRGDVRIAGPALGIQPMLAACLSWGRGGYPPDLNTVDGDAGSCPVVCRWG